MRTHLSSPEPAAMASQRFAMALSASVGLLMLGVKVAAYVLTGSAAILSDAAESVVHVVAVLFATYSLWLSQQPPDPTHHYGHEKIAFFSAGFEGAMIVLAAFYIIFEAVHKWMAGLRLENLGVGILLVAAAAAVNGVLGGYLIWLGGRHQVLVLEANGKHVLTDCWTSVGVVVGLLLAMGTGWLVLDPILAILVALNILWTGGGLIRQAFGGLMDEADPAVHRTILGILERAAANGVQAYHGVRHRRAGNSLWVDLHLLFVRGTPIERAHQVATRIEQEIAAALRMRTIVTTHLEPMEGHDADHDPGNNPGHP